MKIYTRKGDDGTTSIVGGRRLPKQHIRIEAYGTVDELIAWIGRLRAHSVNNKRTDILVYIQGQLMSVAANLAHDNTNPGSRLVIPDAGAPERLEKEIDMMESMLKPLDSFILPGGDQASADCHITRTVCRRAERNVLRLDETEIVSPEVKKLLNRLSDYLFVLGRLCANESGNEEVKWKI